MMESIDKLRELATGSHCYISNKRVLEFVNEIEAECQNNYDAMCLEIERDYMLLTKDADGVPIRPGDLIEYDYGDIRGRHTVVALIYDGTRTEDDGGIWDFEFDDDEDGEDTRAVNNMRDFYSCNRHCKPRTVEDVLREFVGEWDYTFNEEPENELIEKYADKLREVLENE